MYKCCIKCVRLLLAAFASKCSVIHAFLNILQMKKKYIIFKKKTVLTFAGIIKRIPSS